MKHDKVDAARRQLGTALHLFIHDLDPISVHCLARGGGELAEHLVQVSEQPPFALHVLETFPDMVLSDLRVIRNQYWNAFKHATSRNGIERNDAVLLEKFSDKINEFELFIGWYDLGRALNAMPIEAQVFQAWFFAKHPERVRSTYDPARELRLFPDLENLKPKQQKQRMRRVIEKARTNTSVMADPRTDRRKLILS